MQTPVLHFFRRNKKGATLMELMAMLLVVSLTLTTFFYTLTQTMNFSQDTEARIKAVSLAREGIEAVTNIRNTNWLRFSSSRSNCWDTFNYDANCITNAASSKIENNANYVLKNAQGLWKLEKVIIAPTDLRFIQETKLFVDTNGWYVGKSDVPSLPTVRCQNIATSPVNCVSWFSRVIKISNKDDKKMTVTSEVSWRNMF